MRPTAESFTPMCAQSAVMVGITCADHLSGSGGGTHNCAYSAQSRCMQIRTW